MPPLNENERTQPIQRFVSHEHQSLGNQATASAQVNVGDDAHPLMLAHGDVIALSGDWFSPDDDPHKGLFGLGRIPGLGGAGVGTQDEIIAAIQEFNLEENQPPDPRFANFHASDAVKKAVKDRYRQLAADNAPHFVAPRGRDASGQVNPAAMSAGLKYRQLHEQAIDAAFDLGRIGGDESRAMAMEAAAQHFLTDTFSAGHLRTPTADIRDYWKAKYPLFWYNLRNKIALDTASEMNAQETNLATIVGTVREMYDQILAAVMAVTATYPELGFGDLVTKLLHDYDNRVGLEVQGGGRVFGDDQLDLQRGDNVTRARAVEAVQVGNEDIRQAFAIGQTGQTVTRPDLHAAVRIATGAPADAYVAETKIPVPTGANPELNWKAPNFETLWDMPLAQGGSYKIADMIAFELKPGSELFNQLNDLGDNFPVEQRVGPFGITAVHPRRAYQNGFLKPLVNNPAKAIRDVIHWSPSQGDLRGIDRDDVALATGLDLDRQLLDPKDPSKGTMLSGMTTTARIEYVKQLIDGNVAPDEEDMVMRIFATSPPGERPEIYRGVERHPWTGQFVRGLFVRDDDLVDALSNDRLDRLAPMINAGRGLAHEVIPTPQTPVDTVYDQQGNLKATYDPAQHKPGQVDPLDRRPPPQPPPDQGPPQPVPPAPQPQHDVCPVGPQPHPLVRVGDMNLSVAEMQCKLDKAATPLLPLKVDTIFGPRTRAGVASYQHHAGLIPTGAMDPTTWAALDGEAGEVPHPHPNLVRGAVGAAVSELQTKLNAVGAEPLPLEAHGAFGILDESGVVAFQDGHNLAVDGVVGDHTWAALDAATSSP